MDSLQLHSDHSDIQIFLAEIQLRLVLACSIRQPGDVQWIKFFCVCVDEKKKKPSLRWRSLSPRPNVALTRLILTLTLTQVFTFKLQLSILVPATLSFSSVPKNVAKQWHTHWHTGLPLSVQLCPDQRNALIEFKHQSLSLLAGWNQAGPADLNRPIQPLVCVSSHNSLNKCIKSQLFKRCTHTHLGVCPEWLLYCSSKATVGTRWHFNTSPHFVISSVHLTGVVSRLDTELVLGHKLTAYFLAVCLSGIWKSWWTTQQQNIYLA